MTLITNKNKDSNQVVESVHHQSEKNITTNCINEPVPEDTPEGLIKAILNTRKQKN